MRCWRSIIQKERLKWRDLKEKIGWDYCYYNLTGSKRGRDDRDPSCIIREAKNLRFKSPNKRDCRGGDWVEIIYINILLEI